MDNLQLWVFAGNKSVLSIDPDSNVLLHVLKMYGLTPFIETKQYRFSLNNDVKLMSAGRMRSKIATDILNILMTFVNEESRKTRTDTLRTAYHQRLFQILLFNNWGSDINASYSVGIYNKHMSVYGSAICGTRIRNTMLQQIDTIVDYENILDITSWLRNEASSCFDDLNKLVSGKKYVCGDSPCVADAIFVGYLGPILYLGHPDNTVRNLLIAQDALYSYVVRVNKQFAVGPVEPVQDRPSDARTDRDETGASWPLIVGAGAFATCGMVGYALAKGLFRFSL